MSLTVLCPTRGRPDSASEAYAAFQATKTRIDTTMVFVVDTDDPLETEYVSRYPRLPVMTPLHEPGMGPALNAAAEMRAKTCDILGFVGDDHRFRTPNWDARISDHLLAYPGVAYANDLLMSEQLPTQVFISSAIVDALGWMALPGAKHLYLDNTWRELGEALESLFYFPDLIIEHLHPAAGKAAWDEAYLRVNSQATYEHDAAIFAEWKANGLATDAARARTTLR